MKTLCASVIAMLGLVAIPAMAQDCTTPLPLSGPSNLTGNTCTATNALSTICLFSASPANDVIYTFTVAAGYTANSITLTPNDPTYAPGLIIITTACSGNSTCGLTASGAPGATISLNVSGGAVAPGTYWLAVTSAAGTNTCGPYGLAVDGTLPVTLTDFTVS
jgi:hypothetical protein